MSKFKELKGVIHGPRGALKVTSLSNFLSLITPEYIVDSQDRNDSKLAVKIPSNIYGQPADGELTYWEPQLVTVLVDMIPMGFNHKNRLELMRFYLLDQSRMLDISNKDLNQEIYDASQSYVHEYGKPTHLVRVASRLWMVANPDDFIIFVNKETNKIGLFVKDDKRTKIYSVHRGEPKTFRMLGMN